MSRECLGCGRDVPIGIDNCPYCTAPFKVPEYVGKKAPIAEAADEKIFYSSDNITVTSARFVAGNQTYAMRNITSVKTGYTPRKILGPFFGCLLVFIVGALIHPAFGLVACAIVAYWLWKNGAGIHHIIISTAAGESPAYSNSRYNTIHNIHKALSDAIVARG